MARRAGWGCRWGKHLKLEVADPGMLEDGLKRQPVGWVKGEELVEEVQVGR